MKIRKERLFSKQSLETLLVNNTIVPSRGLGQEKQRRGQHDSAKAHTART